MRNMSFALTTRQVRAGTKIVTRRLGWWFLKGGEVICAIEKGQGLKKGEKVVRIRMIKVISARGEPLNKITKRECVFEGFPDVTPKEFVEMFCKHNKCEPTTRVNRIHFEYLS